MINTIKDNLRDNEKIGEMKPELLKHFHESSEKIVYINSNLQICSIRMRKDMSITLNMTQFAEIPIFIMMRALGIETDSDIYKYIIYDCNWQAIHRYTDRKPVNIGRVYSYLLCCLR
mgnify:CR=1 FL=1